MKKHCIKPFERVRYIWRSLVRVTYHNHDPFLVYSMASFNSGGGWKEFLLKASLQNT